MQILCFDIGSTTQDILHPDTGQPVENAIRLASLFGSRILTGWYGLVKAPAIKLTEYREEIERPLTC